MPPSAESRSLEDRVVRIGSRSSSRLDLPSREEPADLGRHIRSRQKRAQRLDRQPLERLGRCHRHITVRIFREQDQQRQLLERAVPGLPGLQAGAHRAQLRAGERNRRAVFEGRDPSQLHHHLSWGRTPFPENAPRRSRTSRASPPGCPCTLGKETNRRHPGCASRCDLVDVFEVHLANRHHRHVDTLTDGFERRRPLHLMPRRLLCD